MSEKHVFHNIINGEVQASASGANALTATIGTLVAEAGARTPVIIIAGFLPMFLAAYAYRELNKVAPDWHLPLPAVFGSVERCRAWPGW